LEINETELQSLRNEGVNGYNFLRLNNELLKKCGIRVGQRASLIEIISNLNSQSKFYDYEGTISFASPDILNNNLGS
jgi:hypothetical protein